MLVMPQLNTLRQSTDVNRCDRNVQYYTAYCGILAERYFRIIIDLRSFCNPYSFLVCALLVLPAFITLGWLENYLFILISDSLISEYYHKILSSFPIF